jgi:hypothetical protein
MAAAGRPNVWRGAAIATIAAIAVTAFSACTGSGYSYVKSSSTRTYFKVPGRWRLYSRDDIIQLQGADLLPKSFKQTFPFFVVFDGSPNPSIRHDLSTATSPFGLARVRKLSLSEHDSFSLQSLRNEIIKIDDLLSNDASSVEVVAPPKAIVLKHGVHGTRLMYTVHPTDGSDSFTVEQIGMTDPTANTVWFLILGCQVKCFSAHRREIDTVVNSWTIQEKK